MRSRKIVLAVAAALPIAAAAQQELPAVVVTGSATAKAFEDAPASISVLTREDIERRPVQELNELLGTVPGVTLNRSGNMVPGVQLRGLGSAYTLILIDGRRVNSTSAVFRGNDYDFGWIPPEEIERIEVVRGPMSSLYGSDAIGGVVNIITKKVGQSWRGSARADGIFQENSLAGDTWAVNATVSGPLIADTLGVRLTGAMDRRAADDPSLNPPAANGISQPAMPNLQNQFLSGRMAWTPNASNDVILDLETSSRDHGGFELDRDAWSIAHSGRYDFGSTQLRFYGDVTKNQTGTVTGQINPNRAEMMVLDGKYSNQFDLLVPQTLSIGGEYRNEELKDPANLSGPPGFPARTDPSTEISQWALFLEDDIAITRDFTLTAGVRYDDHEKFGGHTSPRIYGVYRPLQGLTLRAGYSEAFRAPTLLQNSPYWGSVSCGSPTVGCYIIGSEELEPETSESWEVGAMYDGGFWGLGATYFDNRLKNMIDITNRTANRVLAPTYPNFVGFLPDGRPIFRYENIASVETSGVEVSGRLGLFSSLNITANYTYTDAKNTSGTIDLPLTYRPENVANITADWQALPDWVFSTVISYTGSQYISVPANGLNLISAEAFTTADIMAAWNVTRNFTLRFGVLNVADETVDRTNTLEFNVDGRRYFVSLTGRFF